jgi:signal transduction histidine kinase
LTASIAHEINTPLGVIRGATANIIAAFNLALLQLPSLLQQLSSQQQTAFFDLVNTAFQQTYPISTQAERQLRRQLHAQLAAQGIADAAAIATQLTLLRLDTDLQPYQALLADANAVTILKTASNLVLQHQNARSIQQEVDRAAKIVFALKTYSYQGKNADKSLQPITDSIELALTLYHNRLKRGIQLIRRYGPAAPEVFCNPDELTQVWVNLIDNAIYAMDQQGTLEITVTQQADWVTVSITDSGSGIPAEVQARIFEPFFTTKPRGEGSGLGLDIVQQIVHKHTGTIQVQSQPGKTTFTIQLPLPQIESQESL